VKEEHFVPVIRHEDEVGLQVCFTVWKICIWSLDFKQQPQ
jgi:hypothetical protein